MRDLPFQLQPRGVRFAALAGYLPPAIRTNADLVALGCPLSVEEIEQLSGIQERRIALPEQATSDLAAAAAERCLSHARIAPDQLDRIIVATTSPDHLVPSTACLLARRLGVSGVPAFDLAATCSGFLFAVDAAARAVLTGDRAVLVVAAEVRSRFVSPSDRSTGLLFGDGAAAALVVPSSSSEGLEALSLTTVPEGVDDVCVPAGGSREPASRDTVADGRHVLKMASGPALYIAASEGMLRVRQHLLEQSGLTDEEIDLIVPHQANGRLLTRLQRIGQIAPDKLMRHISHTGNVSGASCALALISALSSGRVLPGGRVMVLTCGAGYTAGGMILRIDESLLSQTHPLEDP